MHVCPESTATSPYSSITTLVDWPATQHGLLRIRCFADGSLCPVVVKTFIVAAVAQADSIEDARFSIARFHSGRFRVCVCSQA